MKVPFSHLHRPVDPDPVLALIRDLVIKGELVQAKTVEAFEEAFAAFVGSRYAIGVGSGTDALFLSLKALGVTHGQEVITCANAPAATAGAIHTAGARIVFVDCTDTFVMDPDQVEAAITNRTSALVPIHFAGQPAELERLRTIAQQRGIALVEDASAGLGAAHGELRCGAVGLLAGFGFHPHKGLPIWGDGGMITTHSEGLFRKLQLMRNHGMLDRETYAFFSFNSRLDSLQAAIGHHLLTSYPAMIERRIQIAHRYDSGLADLAPHLRIPPRAANIRHVFQLYIVQAERRNLLLHHLAQAGIEAKVHYPRPLHLQPAAAPLGYQPGSFPRAEQLADEAISLPCHPQLTDEEVDWVISAIQGFYRR